MIVMSSFEPEILKILIALTEIEINEDKHAQEVIAWQSTQSANILCPIFVASLCVAATQLADNKSNFLSLFQLTRLFIRFFRSNPWLCTE